MPRTQEANRQLRETQQAKILDAAWKVFARWGTTTTMADVATEAAISYGLAYRYFPSKDALFRALIEHRLQSGVSELTDARQGRQSPGIHLRSLIRRLIENRRNSPEMAQVLRQVLSDKDTPEDLRTLAQKHGQRFQALLRRLILEGQKTGEVAEGDAEQLVTAIVAYLDGLSGISSWALQRMKQHFPDPDIILRILEPSRGRWKSARTKKPARP